MTRFLNRFEMHQKRKIGFGSLAGRVRVARTGFVASQPD